MTTAFNEAELQFLQLLDGNPEFREAVRQRVLVQELLALPGRFSELVQIVRELSAKFDAFAEETNRRLGILEEQAIEANRRLGILEEQAIEANRRLGILQEQAIEANRRLGILEEQAIEANRRFTGLENDVGTLQTDVDTLKADVRTLKTDVGMLMGNDLERRVRDNILNIARDELNLTRGRILLAQSRDTNPDLLRRIEAAEARGLISETETDHVLVADIIIRARRTDDHQYVYAVFEVSRTIRQNDLERARDRAAVIAAATGEETVAAVVGQTIHPQQQAHAQVIGVRVIIPARFQPEALESAASESDLGPER